MHARGRRWKGWGESWCDIYGKTLFIVRGLRCLNWGFSLTYTLVSRGDIKRASSFLLFALPNANIGNEIFMFSMCRSIAIRSLYSQRVIFNRFRSRFGKQTKKIYLLWSLKLLPMVMLLVYLRLPRAIKNIKKKCKKKFFFAFYSSGCVSKSKMSFSLLLFYIFFFTFIFMMKIGKCFYFFFHENTFNMYFWYFLGNHFGKINFLIFQYFRYFQYFWYFFHEENLYFYLKIILVELFKLIFF